MQQLKFDKIFNTQQVPEIDIGSGFIEQEMIQPKGQNMDVFIDKGFSELEQPKLDIKQQSKQKIEKLGLKDDDVDDIFGYVSNKFGDVKDKDKNEVVAMALFKDPTLADYSQGNISATSRAGLKVANVIRGMLGKEKLDSFDLRGDGDKKPALFRDFGKETSGNQFYADLYGTLAKYPFRSALNTAKFISGLASKDLSNYFGGLVEGLDEAVEKEIGTNKESLASKATNFLSDLVVSLATGRGVEKIVSGLGNTQNFVKATDAMKNFVAQYPKVAQSLGQVSPFFGKALRFGAEGALDGIAFDIIKEGEPTTTSALMGGLLGVGVAGLASLPPTVGRGIKSVWNKARSTFDPNVNDLVNKTFKPRFANKDPKKTMEFLEDTKKTVKLMIDNPKSVQFQRVVDDGDRVFTEAVTGEMPKTLGEFESALDDMMSKVYKTYNALTEATTGQGIRINMSNISDGLEDLLKNEQIIATNPGIRSYVQNRINALKGKSWTPDELQDYIQKLNKRLASKNISPNDATNLIIDRGLMLNARESLLQAIERGTGQGEAFNELRGLYRSMRSIQDDVVKQTIVTGRKNQFGLFDIADLFAVGDVASGNPRGIVMATYNQMMKSLNNPDKNLQRLFKKMANDPMDMNIEKIIGKNPGDQIGPDNVVDSQGGIVPKGPINPDNLGGQGGEIIPGQVIEDGIGGVNQSLVNNTQDVLPSTTNSNVSNNVQNVTRGVDEVVDNQSIAINADEAVPNKTNIDTVDNTLSVDNNMTQLNTVSKETPKSLIQEVRKYKSADEFVESVTKGEKEIGKEIRPTLYKDDIQGLSNGKIYKKESGYDYIKDTNGDIYIQKQGEDIGYIQKLSENETDLVVVKEFQGKGIGTKLVKEFLKTNPDYLKKSGGFTESGLSTYKKALKEIREEANNLDKKISSNKIK